MPHEDHPDGPHAADTSPGAGIVVHHDVLTPFHPRSVAFVWGRETLPAPSLPFGRWKPGARAA